MPSDALRKQSRNSRTAGKLQKQMYRRPTGGPRIAVYHPKDVQQVRKERNPEAPPFVLSPEKPEFGLRTITDIPWQIETFNKLLNAPQSDGNRPPSVSELRFKLYLTPDEAVAFTGLGKGFLQRTAARYCGGPRGSIVYKRSELEKL